MAPGALFSANIIYKINSFNLFGNELRGFSYFRPAHLLQNLIQTYHQRAMSDT